MSDKMPTVAAVAVTAIICIAGTYMILDGDVQKQVIHVVVSDGISVDDMSSLFTEFEDNANAVMQMAADTSEFTEDHVKQLLNGDADVVITKINMTDKEGFDTIGLDDIFIVFRSDAQGIVNFFKNWLHSQT